MDHGVPAAVFLRWLWAFGDIPHDRACGGQLLTARTAALQAAIRAIPKAPVSLLFLYTGALKAYLPHFKRLNQRKNDPGDA